MNTFLASASFDNTAKVWRLESPTTMHELQTLKGHTDVVHAVSFSLDSQTLDTVSYDEQIDLFKLGSKEQPHLIEKAHDGHVDSVSFSNDGKQLLSSGQDRLIKLWNIQTSPPTLSKTLPPASDKLMWSSWSPDNQWIAAVGRSLAVDIYATASSERDYHLTGHENTVFKAIFLPDSQQLATVSVDTTTKFWELEQGKQLFSLHLPMTINDDIWDFDFRYQADRCLMAEPLVRGVLQLYQFSYEDKPNFDQATEKRALLPLWQSYLDKTDLFNKTKSSATRRSSPDGGQSYRRQTAQTCTE